MKITFTISFTCLLFACQLMAQQLPQYSLYRQNKFAFNPGYAGLDNSLSITGVYRNQWAGLPGGPVTQNFNAHMPLGILGGGVGLLVENETMGSWRHTSFNAAYARQLQVSKNGILSLGLMAGWVQRQLDGSKVRTPSTTIDDFGNVESHNDDFSVNQENTAGPTVHVGAFYQGENLEVGVSVMNLAGNRLNSSNLPEYRQDRTYLLYLGYKIEATKTFSFIPSIILKTDVYQTQIDFSVVGQYNENIFVGGSFRGYAPNSVDAVALMGGFKLTEKVSVAYAYDLGLSGLRSVNNGSHEIMLNYNLGTLIGNGKAPSIIYNPRSL